MALAWLLLAPLGILAARFFKIRPGQDWPAHTDDQVWWWTHRVCQWGTVLLATLGFVLLWRALGGAVATSPHAWLGGFVLVFAWLQVVSTWLRGSKGGPRDAHADPADPSTWRGDHYDMTPRRRLFEAWHKHVGYAVLLAAWDTILLGLDRLALPLWWGIAPMLAFAALFVLLERLGWRRDTWQAIFGPGPPPGRHDDQKASIREAER